MSLKRKLLFSIIVALFAAIIISFTISYFFVSKSETEDFISSSQTQLDMLGSYLEVFVQNLTKTHSILAQDEAVLNANGKLTKYLDLSETITTDHTKLTDYEQKLYQNLLNYKSTSPACNLVYIATQDGGFLQFPDANMPPNYDPTKSPWYQEALGSRGYAILSAPSFINGQIAYSVSSAFFLNGYLQGVVRSDLLLNQLINYLDKLSFANKAQLLIFDPHGYIIYDPAQPSRLAKRFEQINNPEIQELYWHKKDFAYIQIDGVEHLVLNQISPKGWRTMLFIKSTELKKSALRKSFLWHFMG